MVGAAFLVGVGRVEYEFLDLAVPAEIEIGLEGLAREGVTSLVEVSEGRAFTKTRLLCRILTFSSGLSSIFFEYPSSLSLL